MNNINNDTIIYIEEKLKINDKLNANLYLNSTGKREREKKIS